METMKVFLFSVSRDEDFVAHTAERIRNILCKDGMENTPLILEECSNNILQRDLCNDTCYKSAYLFKNILENNQHLNAMGYFAVNDRLEEVPPSEPSGERLYHLSLWDYETGAK